MPHIHVMTEKKQGIQASMWIVKGFLGRGSWTLLGIIFRLDFDNFRINDEPLNIDARDGHLRHLALACVKKASMYLQNCWIYLFMQYLVRRGNEGIRLDMFKKETDELTKITFWVRVRTPIKNLTRFILSLLLAICRPRTTEITKKRLKIQAKFHQPWGLAEAE